MTSYKYRDMLDDGGIKPYSRSEKEAMKSDDSNDSSSNTNKTASLRPLQNVENIDLSATAISKEFRMMTRDEIENAIRRCHKYTVYRVADSDEYHIIKGRYAIIVSVNKSDATVITQMHLHKDYSEETYIRAN